MYAHALKRLVLASLMITVALHATPTFAEVVHGLRYEVPKGWAAGDQNGARVLTPSNLEAGEVMMAILFGVATSTAGVEDQLVQFATSLNAGEKVSSSRGRDLGSR